MTPVWWLATASMLMSQTINRKPWRFNKKRWKVLFRFLLSHPFKTDSPGIRTIAKASYVGRFGSDNRGPAWTDRRHNGSPHRLLHSQRGRDYLLPAKVSVFTSFKKILNTGAHKWNAIQVIASPQVLHVTQGLSN